jgi:hypothetical protein
MAEKKFWFPCFVGSHPAAAVFSHECVIHFAARVSTGHWAIVSKDRLVCAAEEFTVPKYRGLVPALFRIENGRDASASEAAIDLDDLEQQKIVLKKADLVELSEEAARAQLADSAWIRRTYAPILESLAEKLASTSRGVVKLQTGLVGV